MKRKVIDSKWFGLIGIVKVDLGYEIKWYIGQGLGFDAKFDEEVIAERGMPIYPAHLKEFFNINVNESKDL